MAKKKETAAAEPVKAVAAAEPAKPLSAKERLAALSQKAKATTTSTKKSAKRVIALAEGTEEYVVLDGIGGYDQVMDIAKSHVDTKKKILKPKFTDRLMQEAAETGVMPDNPSIATKSSSVTFVLVDKSQSIKIAANPDGSYKTFAQWANEYNIPLDLQAEILDANEVTEREIQVIVSPEKLEETGKAEDIALAEKMRSVLLDAIDKGVFSPDEFQKISQTVTEIKFKEGFTKRAPALAKKGAASIADAKERLKRLLVSTNLIQTQFRSFETTDEKYNEAIAVIAKKQLPGVADASYTTLDKTYKMSVQGSELTIFRNADASGKEVWGKVTTIKCTDSQHAHNKAEKMSKTPKYLKEVLDEIA